MKPSEFLWLVSRFVPHQKPMTLIMEEKVTAGRGDVSEPDSLPPTMPASFWSVGRDEICRPPDQSLASQ